MKNNLSYLQNHNKVYSKTFAYKQKRVTSRTHKKTGSATWYGPINVIIFTEPVNATPTAHCCEVKIQERPSRGKYKKSYRKESVLLSSLADESAPASGIFLRSSSEFSGRVLIFGVHLQMLRTPAVVRIVHVLCSSWTVRRRALRYTGVVARWPFSLTDLVRVFAVRRPKRIWFENESSVTLQLLKWRFPRA